MFSSGLGCTFVPTPRVSLCCPGCPGTQDLPVPSSHWVGLHFMISVYNFFVHLIRIVQHSPCLQRSIVYKEDSLRLQEKLWPFKTYGDGSAGLPVGRTLTSHWMLSWTLCFLFLILNVNASFWFRTESQKSYIAFSNSQLLSAAIN